MPRITFNAYDGVIYEVDAPLGQSMLQAALSEHVPGIDADCGGRCSCATCHIIVNDEWFPAVGPASEQEASMLRLTPEGGPHSRLACQIRLDERLDGVIVRVPEFQM